ncbi:TRM11 family methyltransferase [Tuwongella immobilis]|uniref:DNA methylase N-4/N-6 domain-containing protein n=1 Tax=Tuwongella immobilis TaxID=692036 RepID=A0A6C2YV43_9BACT|nr:hypothetical protein [Tuwongella immobilis]VIP05314.1 Uncharacterized protein OS=Blastopirellula marina DSM 3645 GN=DSM3645_02723 PE=4 SV=1 [Tuwongella immobilis]VTS07984.1 Uncharacterized protein OS=Blastopirellula marina DSM 3645 GN=DSM3645_02723 PE=4 SV=1 [Tuwongella immobilis]
MTSLHPTSSVANVNPFYAARLAREPKETRFQPDRPVYAKLPKAPVNASPVPGLTSLYHDDEPGPYGNRGYPGNCGGNLIRDLIRYFRPITVLDPMTGSGTCRDVCRAEGVHCISSDLKRGDDACGSLSHLDGLGFDLIWTHPPYWRMKIYSDDPRCLSQAPTLEAFLERYAKFLANMAGLLAENGKLAVLMGDYSDRDAGFVPLVYHTKRLAFEAGLRQSCTDIVRFSHGASSGKKVYRSSFIPGLHDICAIFERA